MGATLPYIQTHDHLASTSQHLQSPELRQQLSISPSLFSAQRYINSLVSSICSYHLRFPVSRPSECTYITSLATAVRLIPLPLRLTPSTLMHLLFNHPLDLCAPLHFMAVNVSPGGSLSKSSFPPPLLILLIIPQRSLTSDHPRARWRLRVVSVSDDLRRMQAEGVDFQVPESCWDKLEYVSCYCLCC